MASVGHRVTVNLRLDVYLLLGVCLEPSNIDFHIKVANALETSDEGARHVKNIRKAYLHTIASSGITLKCSAVMISRLPVVVTKMFEREAASSMVVTSYPAIAACKALMGSISVTITREPYDLRDSAHCNKVGQCAR